MAEKVEQIPIDSIYPNKYNPNSMSDDTFWFLVREIRNNGMVQPIQVVKKEKGTYEIVDGEQRWKAAKEVGMKEIPCIVRDLDDDTQRATTLNMDYLHGEENVFKTGKAYKKLKEKYLDTEIADRLAYSQDEMTKIFEVCDMSTRDLLEKEEPEIDPEEMVKFSVRMSDSKYNKLVDTLNRFPGEDAREKFISMIEYYEERKD